jgi:hypothetical protein
MENINRFPGVATQLTTTISQVPSLLAKITAGSAHLLLLVAKLGLSLMTVPLLIPLLLISLLAAVVEGTDKIFMGTASEQEASEAISATVTHQEERVEVPNRRDSTANEPSAGSYRRDSLRGAFAAASR